MRKQDREIDVGWSEISSIVVINDFDDRILELEYIRYNTLYSRETCEEYWFNNTLIPKVYMGMCLYLSPYNSTYILDRYEVIEINLVKDK